MKSITDATAFLGGNTFGFAEVFQDVAAIELDEKRVEDLKHNLQIFTKAKGCHAKV